jgi:hypothetical protein
MDRRVLQRGISSVLLIVTLAGCAQGAAERNAVPTPDPAQVSAAAEKMMKEQLAKQAEDAARASALAAAQAAAAAPPPPEAFTIGILVLEKKCFGSAGCNVVFRIDPSFTGTGSAKNLEVTYEVVGGEDPLTNTFTIDSAGTASFSDRETLSTRSNGAELSAHVVNVRRTP